MDEGLNMAEFTEEKRDEQLRSARDQFAAQAMHALMLRDRDMPFDQIARDAFRVADAMMAERDI
jgi:hypothetical protein